MEVYIVFVLKEDTDGNTREFSAKGVFTSRHRAELYRISLGLPPTDTFVETCSIVRSKLPEGLKTVYIVWRYEQRKPVCGYAFAVLTEKAMAENLCTDAKSRNFKTIGYEMFEAPLNPEPMKRFIASGIEWDYEKDLIVKTAEIELPEEMEVIAPDADAVVDRLSDMTGFCVNSVQSIKEVKPCA
jgi:hypothetical protein